MFPVSGPRGPRKPSLLGPTPPSVVCVPVPAPMGGINAVDGLLGMGQRNPEDSIFQYNLIPSQYGTKVRTGYHDFATEVGDGGVRTLIPFTGADSSATRLFAAAEDAIYDTTAGGAAPPSAIAFAVANSTSGLGKWTNYTTTGGYFCLYCDETNGYYVYTGASDTWAKIAMGGGGTEVSGVDPATFVDVVIFKSRAWFVQKDTASAWFLGVGAIFGAATQFNFGNKFKHGGTLAALFTWTVDGGEGADDYLVAVSTGGDVVIYKGNDPTSASDFTQHGQWYIGPPPAGRRLAGSFGGELYLLSSYGIIPLTRLISGALIQQDDVYISRKISPLINTQIQATRDDFGWEIKLVSSENLLLVGVPARTGFDDIQFVQSLNSQGWAVYRDIPYFTGETWQGNFYIGTLDGRVLIHEGSSDGGDFDGDNGIAIEWSALSVFQEYGEVGKFKIGQFIRPVFLASQAPSYSIEARYDYNLSEVLPPPAASVSSGSVWDVGLWDLALWGGDFIEVEKPVGAAGIGRNIAVAINGSSAAPTILIRYDLMFTPGGLL